MTENKRLGKSLADRLAFLSHFGDAVGSIVFGASAFSRTICQTFGIRPQALSSLKWKHWFGTHTARWE